MAVPPTSDQTCSEIRCFVVDLWLHCSSLFIHFMNAKPVAPIPHPVPVAHQSDQHNQQENHS